MRRALRSAEGRIAGQFIRPFVEGIPRMTSHPLPVNLALRNLSIEYFPEVEILSPSPSQRHSIDEILAVSANCDFDTGWQSAQRLNCRGYFHSFFGSGDGHPREFEPGGVTTYEYNSP